MFELVRSARFEDTRATAHAHVPADLAFLADHFPGVPVLPGSLQLELCAQIAGPLAERACGDQRWAFLGMVRNATFHAIASLPTDLEITAELRRVEPSSVVVAVTASRGETLCCRAELVMMLREAEPEWADAIASARARVARWSIA
jgi:3-hydroxymyristoyl/3-hydroxydecanoyl-(acyl carrier protein) dehydratase